MRLSRPWQGMRFYVPNPPRFKSRQSLALGIADRGGVLVGAEGPVDVLVLPETADPARVRRLPEGRFLEEGAMIMWEGAFLRTLRI